MYDIRVQLANAQMENDCHDLYGMMPNETGLFLSILSQMPKIDSDDHDLYWIITN